MTGGAEKACKGMRDTTWDCKKENVAEDAMDMKMH